MVLCTPFGAARGGLLSYDTHRWFFPFILRRIQVYFENVTCPPEAEEGDEEMGLEESSSS